MEHSPSQRHEQEPRSVGEMLLRALPTTLVSAFSTGFTAWFGTEHYLAPTKTFHTHVRGPEGEKYIKSPAAFVNELKSITRVWKADNWKDEYPSGHARKPNISRQGLKAGELIYTNEEVFVRLEELVRDTGLEKESKILQNIKASGAVNMRGNTLEARQPLYDALIASESRVFNEFPKFAFSQVWERTSKSRDTIEGILHVIEDYVEEHNTKVINRLRYPLAGAVTLATFVGVAGSHISGQRQKEQLETRINTQDATIERLQQGVHSHELS